MKNVGEVGRFWVNLYPIHGIASLCVYFSHHVRRKVNSMCLFENMKVVYSRNISSRRIED